MKGEDTDQFNHIISRTRIESIDVGGRHKSILTRLTPQSESLMEFSCDPWTPMNA